MATFEAHRKLRDALGDEGSEAVTEYVEDYTSELATRADVEVLRSELRSDFDTLRADFAELRADFSEFRGDMYRALWIQSGAIVMVISAVLASVLALANAFG